MIWHFLLFLFLVCAVAFYVSWMRRAEKRVFPTQDQPCRPFLVALGFAESGPEKPLKGMPAPGRALRLACWGVLYMAGVFACQTYMLFYGNPGAHHVDPRTFEFTRLLAGAFMFAITLPCGLGYDYSDLISPVSSLPTAGSIGSFVQPALTSILIALGFATYLLHLHFTARARSLRAFLVLMVTLVLLHGLSIMGFMDFTLDIGGKR